LWRLELEVRFWQLKLSISMCYVTRKDEPTTPIAVKKEESEWASPQREGVVNV